MTTVRANGVELHVEEVAPVGRYRGTAVLVHGLTSDSMASWFLTLAHPLAAAGLRVLLYDLRGHGHSSRPARGYRLEDFVDDLAALLAWWGVDEPVWLFGNSFGGTVAFGYAARNPAGVAGIMTVESAPPTAAWFARLEARLNQAAAVVASGVDGSIPARRVRETASLLDETSIRDELPASDLPDISRISCPILCLYGGDSAVQEMACSTSRLLPQSKHVVIPGQKHTLLIKAPDQVRAEVLPWLDNSAT